MSFPIRSTLLGLLAGLLLSTGLAAPTAKEFAVAVNQSGRQRMLSQKMTKEFLLISQGIDRGLNKVELNKTIRLFDTTHLRLRNGDAEAGVPAPPDDSIKQQLDVVDSIWTPFREALENGARGDVDDKALAFVAKESHRLVTEMDKAVSAYEAAAAKAGFASSGAVVNVAGRQRMLTQRMSKDILLLAIKVDTEAARKDLKWAKDLFEKSLKGLLDGDPTMNLPGTTNADIRLQLGQVSSEWKSFGALVDEVLASDSTPAPDLLSKVAQTNTRLLMECQKVVSAFEGEAK